MKSFPTVEYIAGIEILQLKGNRENCTQMRFGFLRMATTGFAAQALGAKDPVEVRASFARPALMGLALGAVLVALQLPIGWASFSLVDASAAVEAQAHAYYSARIWGAPAVLLNYAVLGWLLGVQRPRLALALQVTVNLCNLGLDLVFVYGLGWGVAGVGAGSAIAQGGGSALGLLMVWRVLRSHRASLSWRVVFDGQRLARLWQANRDLFIRTLCLISAFAWFTAQGAAQGDVVLAANAVLLNFQTLISYALDGFAHAAEALVGEQLGAKDSAGLSAVVRAVTRFSALLAALFFLAYLLGGAWMVSLLTDIEEVRTEAARYLPWVVTSPLVSVWSYQLDGIFIGATRTREMRESMLLSFAAYLALGYMGLWLWGNHGLWAAFLAFMLLRAVTLIPRYPAIARAARQSRV